MYALVKQRTGRSNPIHMLICTPLHCAHTQLARKRNNTLIKVTKTASFFFTFLISHS